jgi:hypothetical protein
MMLIFSVVFLIACVLIPDKTPKWYVGIALFGLGIPVFAWRFIRPDILIVAPDGITWRSALRTSHWQWSDVHRFRPFSAGGRRSISKQLAFDFTDSYRGRSRWLRRTVKAMTGVEGSLGRGWELSVADLADLLNKARIRWAGTPPSHRI